VVVICRHLNHGWVCLNSYLSCYLLIFAFVTLWLLVHSSYSNGGRSLLCPREGCKVKYRDVSMFVCLSARITRKPHGRPSPNFYACWLWPRLGPVLTVLRYVKYFPFCGYSDTFYTTGPTGQNQARRYISKKFARWRWRLDVRQLQHLVEFIECSKYRGAKSAIYDCVVIYLLTFCSDVRPICSKTFPHVSSNFGPNKKHCYANSCKLPTKINVVKRIISPTVVLRARRYVVLSWNIPVPRHIMWYSNMQSVPKIPV